LHSRERYVKAEDPQDPLIQELKKQVLILAEKYSPTHVNHIKFEVNIDLSTGNVTINTMIFNL
jgi:hypothetical protein